MAKHRSIVCAFVVAVGCFFGSSASKAQGTSWTYGTHPVIGTGAYVTVGTEAIGLVCGKAGSGGSNADIVSLRITLGLVPSSKVFPVILFEGTGQRAETAGAPMQAGRRATYFESYGSSCENDIANFQRARAIVLLPGGPLSHEQYDFVGGAYRQRNGGDILGVPGAVRMPLTGSGTAIEQLIRACPALQRDIVRPC